MAHVKTRQCTNAELLTALNDAGFDWVSAVTRNGANDFTLTISRADLAAITTQERNVIANILNNADAVWEDV